MKKKILSFFIAFSMALGAAAAFPRGVFTDSLSISASAASETKRSGYFEYSVRDDGTVSISQYLGKNNPNIKSVSIPSYLDGKPVTVISAYSFYISSYLTEITIPDTVTRIAPDAISHCRDLKTVKLPQSLDSIGSRAFEYCTSLENIVIPDSVKSIEGSAFYACNSLANVNIPKGTELGGDVYARTKWLSEQQKKGPMVIFDGRLIDAKGCSGNVVIPSSVNYICGYAFKGNTKITGVKFHSGIKKIGYGAFDGCTGLTSIAVPGSVKSVEASAFANCTNLKTATISNGTEQIGSKIFYNCSKLEKVVLSNSITAIPYNCFDSCSALAGVTLPGKATVINNNAFRNCTSLKSINIPYGVTDIGSFAFQNCSGLTSANLPESLKFIGQDAFTGCVNLKSLTVPSSLETTYSWCFGYDKNHKKISGFKVICYKGNEKIINMCKADGFDYEVIIPSSRLSGPSRYTTSVEISKATYDSAETVILASGEGFADALAGVPLAAANNAPILLTAKDTIKTEVINEIKRLEAKKVIILGGDDTVSDKVKNTIKNSISNITFERYQGSTRFGTAVEISKKLNANPTEVFFVYGYKYPDALSVGSVAAAKNAPILYLKTTGELDDSTKEYLDSIKDSVNNAYVIGGDDLVPDEMMKKASDALDLTVGTTMKRVSGTTRYNTCVEVNKAFASVLTGTNICVATGTDFPDALSGGVYAAKNKAPMFLVDGKAKSLTLNKDQKTFLVSKKAERLIVFGGSDTVPNAHVHTVAKASV